MMKTLSFTQFSESRVIVHAPLGEDAYVNKTGKKTGGLSLVS